MARIALGLDTSTLSISLALVRVEADGAFEVIASRDRGAEGPNHSTLLPGWIDELLLEAAERGALPGQGEEVPGELPPGARLLRSLDGIAVGIGPGGFTGLRVALATAKGLCYGARLPLVGVSTLEAMGLRAAALAPEARSIVALLDARKREVYAGFYRREEIGPTPMVAPLFEDHEVVAAPDRITERLKTLEAPILLLGEGYHAYRERFDAATEGLRLEVEEALPRTPPAVEIARLGAGRLEPYAQAAVFAWEPRYIRPSDAEFTPARPRTFPAVKER